MRVLESSLSVPGLSAYLKAQVDMFYPDGQNQTLAFFVKIVERSMYRLRICFDRIHLKYYEKDSVSVFNHLNGDQYSMFLYLVSNESYKAGDENLASKVFMLNKAMFGIDAFYTVQLPEHFLFVHPLGTVLGNGVYKDFFVAYQGVTVGSLHKYGYPSFSEKTILFSNTSVLGKCHLGTNSVMAANSSIINTDIGDNQVVVGVYPEIKTFENKNNVIENFFRF